MNLLLSALLLFAALASLLTAAMARELHSSDPAGNGLAQGYFVVAEAVTWLLVLVVLAITGLREPHPHCPATAPWRTIGLVATLLLVVAIAGQFAALRWLFEAGNRGAMRTVLQCGTAAVPLSFVLFAAWRGIGLPLPMSGVLWGCAAVVAVGSAAPLAMLLGRVAPKAPLTITVDNLAYPALLLDGRDAVRVVRYADDLRTVGTQLPPEAARYLLVDANCTTYALQGGATVTLTRQGALDIAALRTRLLELGPLHPDPAEDARIRHLIAMQHSVSALSFVLPH